MSSAHAQPPHPRPWFAWFLLLVTLGVTLAVCLKLSRYGGNVSPAMLLAGGVIVSITFFTLASRIGRLRAEAEDCRHSLAENQAELERVVAEGKRFEAQLASLREEVGRVKAERTRASKLESVGWVAGSIAHDFNNVLTGIMGSVSLLREERGLPPSVNEKLHALEMAGLRAHELTRKLLALNQGGAPVKQAMGIADLVRTIGEDSVKGSKIGMEFDLPTGLPPVSIDPGQISQAMHNILKNAQEAMPEGGRLRVSARVERPKAGNEDRLPERNFVAVEIQDHGKGIPRELLPSIFEPSFTTKPNANGLGLATARAIARKHDGFITARSEPGEGSRFTIWLPALEPSSAVDQGDDGPLTRGKGRILAMDDEPAIRGLLTVLLEHLGYQVTAVADGAETVRQYRKALEEQKPYGAVILDLFVPHGMGGKEAVQELRKVDPQVKAIVSSGDSNHPAVAEFAKHGFAASVEKPYRLRDLASVIESVVSQPATSQV